MSAEITSAIVSKIEDGIRDSNQRDPKTKILEEIGNHPAERIRGETQGKIGKKLGEGGCSEIFEWSGNAKIVKLAKGNISRVDLVREFHNSRIASALGLSVPQVYGVVEVNGRPGLVCERMDGHTMLECFVKSAADEAAPTTGTGEASSTVGTLRTIETPRTAETANAWGGIPPVCEMPALTARLLHQIHRKSQSGLVSQRLRMKQAIGRVDVLTMDEKQAVIAKLDSLPMRGQLCHGDPNPGNIMLCPTGGVVIDWMDASLGNPEADVAEFIVMIRHALLPQAVPAAAVRQLDAMRETIVQMFMAEYERLSGVTYADVSPWIAPVAARRLSVPGMPEGEQAALVAEIRRSLRV